jgi:NADPH:quinone reductase-like Zn-dependent oxidoreductase
VTPDSGAVGLLACAFASAFWLPRRARASNKVLAVDASNSALESPVAAGAAEALVRDGGRFYAFGLASGSFAPISDKEAARRHVEIVRGSQVTPDQMSALTRTAVAMAAVGRLRPVIGQTFELHDAARAHAATEARATSGKTLLIVDRSLVEHR